MDLRAQWLDWRQRMASGRLAHALAEGAAKALALSQRAAQLGASLACAAGARMQAWRKELAPAAHHLKGRVTELAALTRDRVILWFREAMLSARATAGQLALWQREARTETRQALTAAGQQARQAGGGLADAASRLRQHAGRFARRAHDIRQRLSATPSARRVATAARRAASPLLAALRRAPMAPAARRVQRWLESRRPITDGHYRIEVATPRTRAFAVAGVGLLAALAALPAFGSRNLINELIFVLTMLALAQYWNLLAGYAGLVSVGQQAFVGLGGYLLLALTVHQGLDPLVAIIAAGALTAALAVPTALVVFRLRGAYFAIGTWVVAEVLRLVLAQFKTLGGGTGTSLPPSVTNEVAGIASVKALFGVSTSAARDIITYWAALALAAGTVLLVYLILRSRYGLALAAIRDSERAAESVGVDILRTKLKVYIATAAGTGMVGALIYLQKALISPNAAFSVLDWTANVIFIVVIGGIGTIEGPMLGVLVLYVLQTNLAHLGTWYLMLLGAFAIAIMLLAPKGLWGYLSERHGLALFPIRRRLVANRPPRSEAGSTPCSEPLQPS
jgi:branched-chain amino acid transport system permease protein